ncbi:MAG: hypothetical protein H0X66_21480 [Verrucomicrobia bacterium]|nr:hypothetical protein [Verrucomicrobiota bacterium]
MKSSKSSIKTQGYDELVTGISQILEAGRGHAAWSLNSIISAVYWEIGRRIVEFEQEGRNRAEYGKRVIEQLSEDLRTRYGRGFGRSSLFQIRAFYLTYREKVQTVSGQSKNQKVQTLSGQFERIREALPLPWSQYARLLSVGSSEAREFYETEAVRGGWSARQLDRQISTRFGSQKYLDWKDGKHLRALVYRCFQEERTWERDLFFSEAKLKDSLEWIDDDEERRELERVWKEAKIQPGMTEPSLDSRDCAHKIARIYDYHITASRWHLIAGLL